MRIKQITQKSDLIAKRSTLIWHRCITYQILYELCDFSHKFTLAIKKLNTNGKNMKNYHFVTFLWPLCILSMCIKMCFNTRMIHMFNDYRLFIILCNTTSKQRPKKYPTLSRLVSLLKIVCIESPILFYSYCTDEYALFMYKVTSCLCFLKEKGMNHKWMYRKCQSVRHSFSGQG